MTFTSRLLQSPIEYLKGVGPSRGEALRQELGIKTFGDLLLYYPFRYVDRSEFHKIKDIRPGDTVQLVGRFVSIDESGYGGRKRLTAIFEDSSGTIEIQWFRGLKWIQQGVKVMFPYILNGKVSKYKRGGMNIAHPELAAFNEKNVSKSLIPVYSSTEKLTARGLDSKGIQKIVEALLEQLKLVDVDENLPEYVTGKLKFGNRFQTLVNIHRPASKDAKTSAVNRVKFEELFFAQLQLISAKMQRKKQLKGYVFEQVGTFFHKFYDQNLPFELTGAQKRVMKEIRSDLKSGVQMNRLLQGDVGSGKTIVAVMAMLIANDNGFQCCIMAPTEILARQHLASIEESVRNLGIRVGFLSGSVKGQKRKAVLAGLRNGHIHVIIGTHALLEDPVIFDNLGLVIIDEQHRFGVAQRARLWTKAKPLPPHILVMTATPIPRTLSMTMYGDLDVSVIDELPPGRKPVKTIHQKEAGRSKINDFMRSEIAKGRQIYVIFPLIEESEKLDLENLQEGYEKLRHWFAPPDFQISVVHGRMKPEAKDFEMQRFIQKKTQIMVATTVIEVGVNVPNASVMVIENAERFGLSQLHQLRGRVGRGADQSYCVLMSGQKLSKDGQERIKTMCATTNGFEIAEADLRLRGPGDVAGTRQSGVTQFKTVDLALDYPILKAARMVAERILEADPDLVAPINKPIRQYLLSSPELVKEWHRIS